MFDQYGRNINYLRVSLTDRCNLRCIYCMPETMSFRPRSELLQDDELKRLMPIFTELLGFEKIRLTGGEPTVRENIVEIVQTIAQTSGVCTVAMTTNGVLLKTLAVPLAAAGLARVNISIDTLDVKKFKQLTRWGSVDEVWQGILAAQAAGLAIKLNAVIVRGFNDREDVINLARLTYDYPWQVRFIEMMPFAGISRFQQDNVVTEPELKALLRDNLGELHLCHQGQLDGEARVYQLEGAEGHIGFISSVSKPFCASCNRARLTADGRLRLCLLREQELDVLSPLRRGATDQELRYLLEASLWSKPWGHGLAEQTVPLNRVMSEIGG
ncbi:MAG: GTP 3',8-cyclase MoaA [Elainellaceae cyanobacterium]